MILAENGKAYYKIFTQEDPVCIFAANELRKYVELMTNADMDIVTEMNDSDKYIVLGTVINFRDLRYDGYMITETKGNIAITSNYSRGVLYGVYHLLEQNGINWSIAAGIDEYIPDNSVFEYKNKVIENPCYEIRGITSVYIQSPGWVAETADLIDCAVKNRINSVFIRFDIKEEPLSLKFDDLIQKIKIRGVIYETGGLGSQKYVSRRLFEPMPDLFRMKEDIRIPDGNICASNKRGTHIIADRIDKVIRNNSETDKYHLWFDNLQKDYWCGCAECSKLTPYEQQYTIIKDCADLLNRNYPWLTVDMLLYLKSVNDSDSFRDFDFDAENVSITISARGRSYSKCISEEEESEKIIELIDIFSDRSSVIENYADMIIFSKIKTVLASIICRDLKYYHDAGIRNINVVAYGNYSRWAYSINLFTYFKLSWNSGIELEQILKDYCRNIGMESIENVYTEYCLKYQSAAEKILSACNLNNEIDGIADTLLYDVSCLDKLYSALFIILEAGEILNKLLNSSAGVLKEYLSNEKKLLDISYLETEAIYYKLKSEHEERAGNNQESKALKNKFINNEKNILRLIEDVPESYKGVYTNDIFIKKLCNEQIGKVKTSSDILYRSLLNEDT